MEYRYKLKYPENFGDKENKKFRSKVTSLSQVVSVDFDGEYCVLNCKEGTYEYDILQLLIAISDEYNIEVLFGEDADNRPIDGDFQQSAEDEALDFDEASQTDGDYSEQAKPIELDYSDRLSKEKQALKKDSLIRIIELSVAAVLYIVSLFLKAGDTVFSFKTILSILAFSISGYDAVFNAGYDVIKKRIQNGNLFVLIGSIALIILGQAEVSTAVILLFAVSKFIEDYADKTRNLKKEGIFYTGTTPVIVSGQEVARQDIKCGDEITLKEGDVLPVDGILNSDAEVYGYNVDYTLKTQYKKGERVLAGSVAISDLNYQSSCNYGESQIDERKKAFESTVENPDSKSKKQAKIGLYADLLMLFIAVAVTFLLPLTGNDYVEGLKTWGVIGGCVLVLSIIGLTVLKTGKIYKSLYTEGLYKGIEYGNLEAINKLGCANSMKVSATALCDENGGKLKDDSLGALKELYALGVKKITTDFDVELPDGVKKQIDFVEPTLKKENSIYFGNGCGDVALQGGNVKVLNNEISFVPLAYKMAKKSVKLAKFSLIFGIAVKVLLAALVVTLALLGLNCAYLVVIGAFIEVLLSLLLLSVRAK